MPGPRRCRSHPRGPRRWCRRVRPRSAASSRPPGTMRGEEARPATPRPPSHERRPAPPHAHVSIARLLPTRSRRASPHAPARQPTLDATMTAPARAVESASPCSICRRRAHRGHVDLQPDGELRGEGALLRALLPMAGADSNRLAPSSLCGRGRRLAHIELRSLRAAPCGRDHLSFTYPPLRGQPVKLRRAMWAVAQSAW
jgi:hypothetical protein